MNPSRRDFTLQLLCAAGSLLTLSACQSDPADTGEKPDPSTNDSGGSSGDSGGIGGDSGSSGDSGGDSTPPDTSSNTWATGGTASMADSYPDPFTDKTSDCALFCALTLGPCYSETLERRDISEGVDGLPVRLAFRVIDTACNPVAGAVVDIWHTAPNGLYSGEDAAEMCTTGDAAAVASKWFRGMQTTDADGRVDFNTCFPGWYGGRTIHIHFQVRRSDAEYLTSQLFFDQALNDEVCGTHPAYAARGTPDTTNDMDSIASSDDLAMYLLQTARMEDGVMMAWKTLTIRSALTEEICGDASFP